jgi:Predicted membrane protein
MAKKSSKYIRRLLYWRPVRKTLHFSRLIIMPGFQGVPVFDAIYFFCNGLMKGALNQRAAALAFHFFLALFPMLLFFFTLLPYIPIDSLYLQLYDFLYTILPANIYDLVESTIDGILIKKHGGLMSIGFISSVYVASSGINAMILSFNSSSHNLEKRPWWKRRMLSIALVFALGISIILSFVLIVGSRAAFSFLQTSGIIEQHYVFVLLKIVKWTLLVSMVYIMFVILYYYAPTNKENFKFFSAGASLATAMFLLATGGFNLYIKYFSHYNALYGSIGALIIFMLWIYMVSFILLIGFEFNASIAQAISEGYKKTNEDMAERDKPLYLSRTAGNKSSYRRWNRILSKLGFKRIKLN